MEEKKTAKVRVGEGDGLCVWARARVCVCVCLCVPLTLVLHHVVVSDVSFVSMVTAQLFCSHVTHRNET